MRRIVLAEKALQVYRVEQYFLSAYISGRDTDATGHVSSEEAMASLALTHTGQREHE